MNRDVGKQRSRQAVLILRFTLISVFFGVLLYWLQPFADRYQDKTAREWFDEWMYSRKLRGDVIDAFGPDRAPWLLRKIKSVRTFSRLTALLPFGRSIPSALNLDQKHQLAIDWVAILQHRGNNLVPLLLESGETNLIGTILSYGEKEEIAKLLAEETDPVLRFQMQRAEASIANNGGNYINLLLADNDATNPLTSGSLRSSFTRSPHTSNESNTPNPANNPSRQ